MAVNASARPVPRLSLPSLSDVSLLVLNALGLVAYLHPFISAGAIDADARWFQHSTDAPLVFAAVATLCMVLVVAEMTEGGLSSKSLAGLGVLSAMAAVLRTITLPAGANLYFLLVILGGYAFGWRMGFLLGALSFFLSAVVTGGIGPWLPFQMFASAWMGLSAGGLRSLNGVLRIRGRAEVWVVVAFGITWGILFGAITNLWFWPYWIGGPDISYQPGIGLFEAMRRYANFYILTSFGWDLARSICNAVLIAVLGGPLLRALVRFQQRFSWKMG